MIFITVKFLLVLFEHKSIDYDKTLQIIIKSQKWNFNSLVSIADLNRIDNTFLRIRLKLFLMQQLSLSFKDYSNIQSLPVVYAQRFF